MTPFREAPPTAAAPPELDRLVVLASTFRDTRTERREALARSLSSLEDRFSERLVLHTCHRVELIGVLHPDPPLSVDGFRVYRGAEAVTRVLEVAAGFDSAVTAEEQLIGQVREAYETALARGTTGPILNELLRRTIRFGRRVRSHVTPSGDRSLADRAVGWAAERLERRGPPAEARALVVGSGAIGALLASGLAARGMPVVVASRRLERAQRAAAAVGGGTDAISLEAALAELRRYAIVALAVRGGNPLLHADALAVSEMPVVVDLSSPGAVAEDARRMLADDLLDLDALGDTESVSRLPARAERRLRAQLADERDRYIAWLDARQRSGAIVELRRHAAELRERHVARLRQRAGLADDQLAVVEASIDALLAELLHAPTSELRHNAPEPVSALVARGR